jgi:hypothetical protein
MKLRCTENHIRLRLRKSDIAELSHNHSISVDISFGISLLTYRIVLCDQDRITATFQKGIMTVFLPHLIAHRWISTDSVGIEEQVAFAHGPTLGILIEKDFPCLDRPNEDKSNTFFELTDQDNPVC